MDCKHINKKQRDKTFLDGSNHIEVYCADCGAWIKWAPQNNPIKDEDKMFLKKHKGITYGEIFEKDLDYLMWIATGDHEMEDLRVKVKEYLKSKGEKFE